MSERKTIYLDDAIEALRKLPNAGLRWFVSVESLFDVLLKLPPAGPERTTEKLIEGINKMDRLYLDIQNGEIRVLPYDDVIRIIQRIEPERKTGKWIEGGSSLDYPCVCSNCGVPQGIIAKFMFSYCPNCGAEMRLKHEN